MPASPPTYHLLRSLGPDPAEARLGTVLLARDNQGRPTVLLAPPARGRAGAIPTPAEIAALGLLIAEGLHLIQGMSAPGGPIPDEPDEVPDGAIAVPDQQALGALLRDLLAALPSGEATAPTLTDPGRPESPTPRLPDLAALAARLCDPEPARRPTLPDLAAELRRLAATPAALSPSGLRPGVTVGTYRLLRPIGAGGMGVVFEAAHLRLSRRAAVKVLRPEITADPKMVSRFFTEAQSVNVAHHPGIVDTFEFGQLDDGTVYIVMELLTGESLKDRLERHGGRLGLRALSLLRQVASTLSAVHARGIVHRDLKPENLMIVPDPEVPGGERVKILDFGLAKMLAASVSTSPSMMQAAVAPSHAGQALGTPTYMAPEQCRDAATVNDRADVYSLGVILYRALAGRPPFVANTFAELAAQHLYVPPPPLREIDPALPPRLTDLCAAMLAKDPQARPDMAHVAAELAAVLTPDRDSGEVRSGADLSAVLSATPLIEPPVASTVAVAGSGPAAPGQRRRLPRTAALVLAALGAGAVPLTAYLLWPRQAPPARQAPRARPGSSPGPGSGPGLAQEQPLPTRALQVLGEGLRDADPALRRRALALIGQSRDVRHAALAEPLLQDLDPQVAVTAAAALAQLGARGAAPVLIAALSGGPPAQVSAAACAALVLLRSAPPQVPALLRRHARDRDPRVQRLALAALAAGGDDRARRRLLQERAPLEELIPIWGRLARGGDAEARAALAALLPPADPAGPGQGAPAGPDDPALRAAAELALCEDPAESADTPGRRALLTWAGAAPSSPAALVAARALAAADEPRHCERFGQVLAESDRPLPERVLATEGLGACARPSSAPQLAALLPRESGPLRLRVTAAWALLQIAASDPALLASEALSLAEGALRDQGAPEREAAALALGDIEPGLSLPVLGRAIRDEHPEVRRSAAQALGRTQARAAVPVLGGALSDEARAVRREALWSLGKVGRDLRRRGEGVRDVAAVVSGRAQAGDSGEQLAGAAALAQIQHGEGGRREALRAFLRDQDPEVRRQALEALGRVEGTPADEAADEAALTAALADPVFAVRFSAATQLAERGSEAGAAVLRKALRGRGPDALLAQSLLRRLGEPLPPTDPALRLSLTAPVETRQALLAAAQGLTPSEALALLRQGAADPDATVRRRAVALLGELPQVLALPASPQVLRGLLGDPDGGVRVLASALLSRLARPGAEKERQAPREEAAQRARPTATAKTPAAAAKATAPPGPVNRQATQSAAERERSITNRSLVLPDKAIHGTVKINED
jgi:serine/threonine protein kinase/HEAT repeat protein